MQIGARCWGSASAARKVVGLHGWLDNAASELESTHVVPELQGYSHYSTTCTAMDRLAPTFVKHGYEVVSLGM